MPGLITSLEDLPRALAESLSNEERQWIQNPRNSLPFAISSHIASIAGTGRNDPIRRQFIPDPREEQTDPFALDDPLGETLYRVTPRLVHQYTNRALLLAGGSCAGFCRYCFRRVRMSEREGTGAAFISREECESVITYLCAHREIREVLVSGGDPLTAADTSLEELFACLRAARPRIKIRLCSRVPVTDPSRLSQGIVALLARYRPLVFSTHINHPAELAPAARGALRSLADAGLPVLVQTVLLRGLNDSLETLLTLFSECQSLGLKPYYLFQLDLAPSSAHWRVPLREGLELYKKLSKHLTRSSGLPIYAVDLPGGGGKIHLHDSIIAGQAVRPAGKVLLLKARDGSLWDYPEVL